MRQFGKQKGVFRASLEGKRAEMLIYDEIGDDPDVFPVNPTSFAVALTKIGGVDELVLRVNSPGGSVFAGVTMYNALRQFPGKKTVQIDGLCASIASVLAMAADEITMADTAMLMIHNPHVSGFMYADKPKLDKLSATLEQVCGATMLPAYARSGKSEADIRAIMAATTYYSATEAKAEGWVDTILALPTPQRLAARVSYDLRAFAGAPKLLSLAADGCTCPCGPCIDGDCDACSDEDCDCEGCTCDGAAASAKSRKKAADASASQQQAALLAVTLRSRALQLVELD